MWFLLLENMMILSSYCISTCKSELIMFVEPLFACFISLSFFVYFLCDSYLFELLVVRYIGCFLVSFMELYYFPPNFVLYYHQDAITPKITFLFAELCFVKILVVWDFACCYSLPQLIFKILLGANASLWIFTLELAGQYSDHSSLSLPSCFSGLWFLETVLCLAKLLLYL